MCAESPDRLRTTHARATGIERQSGGYRIELDSGARIHAARVVLAMGNPPPAHPSQLSGLDAQDSRYVGDPWQAELARRIGPEEDVLLLGTGLTAIDVALQLEDAGHEGRLIAVSRRGLLPRAHQDVSPQQPLDRPPDARVRTILRDVRQAARSMDWRHAVDRLRPHSQLLWQRMTDVERRRFLRHVRPWWDVHRHRTAPAVAARVDALLASGRLSVHRGRIAAVGGQGQRLDVDIGEPCGKTRRITVDSIINCTGPSADLAAARDPLLVSLRDQGLARADRLGLGLEIDHVGHVVDQTGTPSPNLFAIGPLTRGTFWEITAVPDIRRQVWFLARQLAGAHWVGGEGL